MGDIYNKQKIFLAYSYWRNRFDFLDLISRFLCKDISIFPFIETYQKLVFDHVENENTSKFISKEVSNGLPEADDLLKMIAFQMMVDTVKEEIGEFYDVLETEIEASEARLVEYCPKDGDEDEKLPHPLPGKVNAFRNKVTKAVIMFNKMMLDSTLIKSKWNLS